MSRYCHPDAAARCRRARDRLADLDCVVDVSVVGPEQSRHDRWTVHALLLLADAPAIEPLGTPTRVLEVLADADLRHLPATPQGDALALKAVA